MHSPRSCNLDITGENTKQEQDKKSEWVGIERGIEGVRGCLKEGMIYGYVNHCLIDWPW